MKFPDFALCKERSLLLSDSFARQGIDNKIAYGIYAPTNLRETWDERWQQSSGSEFAHFWLVIKNLFFDSSLLQFGEKGFLWSKTNDSHYTILGYMDRVTKELIECGPYRIQWTTLHGKNGVPTLLLVPV